ncbi:hypothetical protein [Terricaulis sp.]|uniref:hypothetical protein n=1 Tax=Terricaulis sp. TaxID=2768686 RepID=UPI0037831E6A
MASLVAAAAFGVVMATASLASGATNNGGGFRSETGRRPTQSEAQCMARCAPAGSTPEQRAQCRTQCNYPDRFPPDPLDYQFLQRSQNITPNAANRAGQARHP